MSRSSQQAPRKDAKVLPFVPPEGVQRADVAEHHRLRPVFKIVLLILGGLALVSFLGLTGYLVYRNALRKQLLLGLKKVDAMIAMDRPLAYQEAEKSLADLNRKMPGEFSVTLRRAEVAACRWGRFGASRKEGQEARRLLDELLVRSAKGERVQALQAIMALYSGEHDKAAVLAEKGLVHHPRSARLSYVLGMARLRNGELEAAEATLRLAVSYDSKYLPALYHLAVVERLRGRLSLAAGYLQQGLQLSPGHEGALVETALVGFLDKGFIKAAALDRAKRQAGGVPEYRARFLLLAALSAKAQGHHDVAVRNLSEALQLQPQEPEYALALVAMETSRDVEAAARVVLPRWRLLREYPNAALVTARLDLARGRPFEAIRRLEGVRRAGLSDTQISVVDALEIRGMLLAGQWDRAEQRCRYRAKAGWEVSDPRFPACLDLAWIRGDRGLMRRFLRRVSGTGVDRQVIRGLRNLARYRPDKAAKSFAGASREQLRWMGSFAVQALLETGRPHTAADLALRVLDVRGKDVWSRLLLAQAAQVAGHGKTSVAQLRRVEKVLVPTSTYIRFLVGRIWIENGNRHRLDQLIKSLSRRDAGRIWADWLSGLWALSRKKWRRAVDKLTKVVRSDPSQWEAWIDLGRARFRAKDHKGARKAFAEAASRGERPPALLAQMQEALRAGLVQDALRPGMAAARAFRKVGAWQMASTIYARLADAMSRQESYNRRRVKKLFRKALEMHSRSSEAYLLYAEFLRRRGHPEDALAWYERAVSANPESRNALYRRLWCLVHLRVGAQRLQPAVNAFLALEGHGSRARRARHWLRRARALDARSRQEKMKGRALGRRRPRPRRHRRRRRR